MEFFEVKDDKKDYINLLLIADEQESMIDRYINRGRMFALTDNGVKSVCVVTDEGNGIAEIKNLAVRPEFQRLGYGRKMIDFIADKYRQNYSFLIVGTGDSPLTVPFYEKCGFEYSHKAKNFFISNYDRPIFECGIQLIDMLYFKKTL